MVNQEITVHGTFLNIFGVGVHITGAPGIGKSELALCLLYKQHQLIADDCPFFSRIDNKIMGRNPFQRHFLSVRGVGLVDVPLLFGKNSIKDHQSLSLNIHLQSNFETYPLSHLIGEHGTKDILGCLIPCVTIPIINPRNLDVLVETIVKKYLLTLNKVVDPVLNFEELLRKKMESSTT